MAEDEGRMDKRAKFLRIYANLPEGIKEDIMVVVNKKPYTWNSAYLEVQEDTDLGKKILKALEGVIL